MAERKPRPNAADPVFAAIERHKKAAEAFSRTCKITDNLDDEEIAPSVQRAYDRADRRYQETLDVLFATPPTTAAGIKAFLEYGDTLGMWSEIRARSRDVMQMLLRSPVLAGAEIGSEPKGGAA